MASTGGGKIRSKRSKVTSKPYARRSSFLGRVSETVRDFITPSWLSNMWQGVPEEEGDEQPGISHEGAIPTSNAVPGPQPQVSFAHPQTRPNFEEDMPEQNENPDSDDEPEIIEEEQQPDIIMEDQPSTSAGRGGHKTPFTQYTRPLGASTPNDDIKIIAERKPSDKDDAASDTSISTSGCSSLVPHLDKADHREKLSKFNLDRLSEMGRQRSDSPRFRSDSPRLRSDSPRNTSLWSETSMTARSSAFSGPSRPQQSAHSSRRPTFNSSYFCTPRGGSSSFGNTTMTDSPNRSSPFTSPFYPGKTTFGGSSAQRPAKRPRTSPYEVHLPVKRHVRIRPSNRNEVDVTSQTAKRILDTLEKMSTPLSDAKKIPLSPTSSPFSFTPGRSSRLRQPGTPHAPGVHERGVRIPGPPTTGLRIPQVASIADNRQPPLPLPKREPKREAKPQTVSKPPEETSSRLPSTAPSSAGFSFKVTPSTSTTAPARTQRERLPSIGESSKSGGKMRSSKRETHYKSPVKDEDDVQEVPDLPNIPLPLANGKTLPTFQFGSSKPISQGSGSSRPVKPFMASTPAPFKATSLESEGAFKFASPIVKESPAASQEAAPAPAQSLFKFSAPKQAGPSDASRSTSGFSAPPKVSFGGTTSKPSTSNQKPVATEEEDDEEEEEEASGGIKVAKELKKGSCLEVFGMLSKSNKESTDARKPQASSGSATTATKPLSLADKFKQAPGTWSCEQCMVKNKPELDKCACCTAAKPGGAKPPQSTALFGQSSIAKPTDGSASKALPVTNPPPVTNSGFGDKFKKAAGSWKCDTCLVTNTPIATKCNVCGAGKPGGSANAMNSTSAPPAAAAAPMYGFGDKFKSKADNWKCDTCMISNKSTLTRCAACETPKPGSQQSLNAPPASAYKFGDASAGGISGGGFKFGSDTGIQNSGGITSGSPFKANTGSITSGTSGFKFGAPLATTTSSETKQDSNPSDTKPFKFGKSDDDNAKSSSESAPVVGGFKMANPAPGGFKFGSVATTNCSDSVGAPPPNADPFKSGALSAPITTKPVVNVATVTVTDGEPAKVTSAPTKPLYNFGAAGAKTDTVPAVNFSTASSTIEQKSTFNFGGPKTNAAAESQSAATNPVFKFGGGAPAAEKKDSSSNPAFTFGKTDTSTISTASDAKSIFGDSHSKPSAQANAASEQSTDKPLFNFKSSTTNTSFQFGSSGGSSGNAAEQKPAQENKAVFNFTGAADNKASFNFGAGAAKTTESKDAGSTNSLSKQSGFVFGTTTTSSNPTTNTSNTAPAASVTPFKFGDSAPQNSGTFVFGGTPAATSSQPTAPSTGGFSFTPAAPVTTQQPTPAFGGTSTTTNSVFPGFGSNASSANPSPVFGNPAPTTTSTSVPNFGTAANTPFGSQSQQQGAAAPAFGAANSGTPFGGTPAPAFGAGSTPAFGANSAAPAFGGGNNTAPAFGNNNATQQNAAFQANATPAFQFGGAANQTPQQNSGVFKFGATQNNNATPAAQNTNTGGVPQGFNFSAQQAPSFNFGASAPSASTPSAGASPFQFNASGSGSNPFNPMPTSGSTHSGRKIKRAVRRNPRK